MSKKENKIKIYFTSDIHGYMYPTSYGDYIEKNMGLFQCAGAFDKDENTLVIDGGDILQGSAFAYYCKQKKSSPEIIADIMNDCGYDYFTLGNHDFNYGIAYQNAYIKRHQGKCLCQNICDEEGKTLFPYEIRKMGNGVTLGIVGIVTDYINVWEKKENLEGIQVTDPFEAARNALSELKDKVDATICIYHGGFERDVVTGKILSTTTENVGYRICEELEFDLLLTGHQHMSIDGQYVNKTYVVQSIENAREYHCVELCFKKEGKKISSQRKRADVSSGRILREKYQAFEQEIQEWLNLPIGHLSEDLLPKDKVEMALHGSSIADFLNKVQLFYGKSQLSAVGLANEIAGFRKEVSTRDIIATYPYPNTLVVCEISGKQLKQAMERSAEYFACKEDGTITVSDSFLSPKIEHYNYDYYAGVEYEIHPKNAIGSRITNVMYRGKEVKDEEKFTLCLNNYRFSGAGGYEVYRECKLVKEINVEMVELIMDYFSVHPFVEV